MDTVAQHKQVLSNLRDRASSQAQMKVAIIDQLLTGMPDDITNEDIEARADVVFQYVQQQMQFSTLH
jgi:type I restriction enzyme, R subunit